MNNQDLFNLEPEEIKAIKEREEWEAMSEECQPDLCINLPSSPEPPKSPVDPSYFVGWVGYGDN